MIAFDLLPLIRKKRNREILSKEDIEAWIHNLASKHPVPEYQTSALLAFIFAYGMSSQEVAHLLSAMRFSGKQFKYKGFPKSAFFVDKHSTGGVGDKITLALAPLVAAAGEAHDVYFPTIAGRGLGHTGGTIDKLESIPGFSCKIPLNTAYSKLKKNHLCFLAQTSEIVPADRAIYALRDVTGTVESIPLITASILSKKLSESLDFLLIDLKTGSGAFFPDESQSLSLGQSLLEAGKAAGAHLQVWATRMDTPLGEFSGNRLEVDECIQILKNEGPSSSTKLTFEFAKELLKARGLEDIEAESLVKKTLQSGAAFEKFREAIEAQGGSLKNFEKARLSSQKKIKTLSLTATESGYLDWDVRKIGLALVELGAGRKRKDDKVDLDVGIQHPKEKGDRVEMGDEILKVFYRDRSKMLAAKRMIESSIHIRSESFPKKPLIQKVLK